MNKSGAINILITGVGGQGNVAAAHLLGALGQRQGYRAVVGEMYGLSQRGGSVVSHVRFSSGEPLPPLVPKGEAHVIVGLEPLEALRQLCLLGNENTVVIVNSRLEVPVNVMTGRTPGMAAEEIFEELRALSSGIRVFDGLSLALKAGGSKTLNLVMMGALIGSGILPFRTEGMAELLAEEFGASKAAMNMLAFEAGIAAAIS